MSSPADSRSQRERQLDLLIARFYVALEGGQAPEHEEFIAEHPEFAGELREFFSNLANVPPAARRDPRSSEVKETTAPFAQHLPPLTPGSLIRYFGDYEILEELGSGGMGVVYKARQQKLKRIVALKMIKVGQFANEIEIQRFQAEARAAARLTHPGIVSVHEVGIYQGCHFYAMDFVDGGSLSRLQRDEPIAGRRAALLLKQLAEAVHYAHQQGIVHRDLKPANVLLTSGGAPRITDFGLAKRLWADSGSEAISMTESGQILGTAGYMAPEQAAGKSRLVGPAADIYALGAILYALLTGRAPFVGESQADTIVQVLEREPVSPRALNPSVARDLETICLKCLRKEPHQRYGTGQLLAEDVARYLEGRPVLARPVSAVERAVRWCRRKPVVASLAAALVLALVVGTAVSAKFGFDARREAAAAVANAKATQLEKERADRERDAAEQAAEDARTAEKAAARDRQIAEEQRDVASGRLYVSDMQLADRARREGHLLQMQGRLERHQPAGEGDRRGWEWYYLRSQAYDERLVQSFDKHAAYVASVAWHPGGELIASSSDDGSVRVWDTSTGAEHCTIVVPGTAPGDRSCVLSWNPAGDRLLGVPARTARRGGNLQTPAVYVWNSQSGAKELEHAGIQASWSADGQRLVVLTDDGVVKIWNGLSEDPTRISSGSEKATAAALSPDGLHAAVADQASAVRVVKLAAGETRATLSGHTAPATVLAFGPDGAQLATAGADKTVRIWNTATGAPLQSFAGLVHPASRLQWTADGTRLAAACGSPLDPSANDSVKVWDVTSGELLWEQPASDCAWSGDGKRLAALLPDGTIGVWDAGTWVRQQPFVGHTARTCALAWSSDNFRLATGGADMAVKVWDAAVRPAAGPVGSGAIAWHPQGTSLAVVSPLEKTIKIFNPARRQVVATLAGHTELIRCLAWHPQGTALASGSWGVSGAERKNRGELKVWNIDKQTATLTLDLTSVWRIAWSRDGERILASGYPFTSPTMRVFDAATGAALASWEIDKMGQLMTWSDDGRWFAYSATNQVEQSRGRYGRNNAIVVRDVTSGEQRRTLTENPLAISALDFHPERPWLAVGGYGQNNRDGQVIIWDLDLGERVTTLHTHDELPAQVAFHPTDERLLVGGRTSITLWDLTTFQELLSFESPGFHAAWRPDGKALAVPHVDGNVRLWDASLGYEHAAPLPGEYFRRATLGGGGGYF